MAAGVWLAAAWAPAAIAQAPAVPRTLPGSIEPGRIRPVPEPPAQPKFEFTIEQPGRSQVPRSVEELHFRLNDVHVEGAKALPAASFRPLYAKLIGHEVTLSNILDVADAIEDAYRSRGYIISHAFVPPQRVRDGVFTIRVVEGYVANILIQGASPSLEALIRSYFASVLAERPLRLATMERALLLVNDLSGVAATGVLRPSPQTPGASDLAVSVAQQRLSGGLNVDNRSSVLQGVWTYGGDVEGNGLIAAGDQLAARYASSPDLLEKTAGQIRYRVPIGSNGLVASMIGTVTHGETEVGSAAVAQPVQVVTDSYAVGPRLTYPLVRSRAESLILDGGLTVQNAKAALDALPFTDDNWRVADIAATYSLVALDGLTTGAVDLSHGLPIFGATPNGSPQLSTSGLATGSTSFTKIVGTLHHTRSLYGPVSLALAVQAQYGFDALLAGEQIAFGGSAIGRGYDPGALTGDRGVGGSFELRYDARFPEFAVELLQPYLFYDTAKVWNVHPGPSAVIETPSGPVGTGSGLALFSAGLGVRVFLKHNLTADLEFAHTFKPVIGSGNGKTASKLLFEAAVRF